MNRSLVLASLLLCATGAHAQLYKWVGPDGKITYGDTPPPTAKSVETKYLPGAAGNTDDLPYELAQATKASPVTLYTTPNCLPCDDGRKLLSVRGIPFNEKTVATNDDAMAFRKIAGANATLPFLTVGRDRQTGFESGAWNRTLTAAGYPENNVLPKTWRNPAPQAAAPTKTETAEQHHKPDTATRSAERESSGELPPALGNAPPGFRF